MLETILAFLGSATIVSLIVGPYIALRVRAGRKRQEATERARSIESRLEEIRDYAISMQSELPETRQSMMKRFPDREEAWLWIGPTLEYCQKLESLVGSPQATIDDAHRLADESSKFLRETKVKGILVPYYADKLAEIIRDRELHRGDSN